MNAIGMRRRLQGGRGGAMNESLPFIDDFARADGALGNNWTGATWTISSGAALNTPTLTQVLTDPGVENWSDGTHLVSWAETVAGTSTVNQETSVIHGGSNACRLDVDASTSGVLISQTYTYTGYAEHAAWSKASAAGKQARLAVSGARDITLTTTFAKYFDTFLQGGSVSLAFSRGATSASSSLYGDDFEANTLALANLIATRVYSQATVKVTAAATVTAGTFAGVCACMDSAATPKYGVLAYHNGISTLRLVKVVNGAYTQLLGETVAYSAGALVEIRHPSPGIFQLFYAGAQRGATQDLTAETGVISNKLHGLFSTNLLNRLDGFFVAAP